MSILEKEIEFKNGISCDFGYYVDDKLALSMREDYEILSLEIDKDSLAYLKEVVNIAEKHLKQEGK